MYEHIIKRLETAIEKHEQKEEQRDGKFHSNFKTHLFDRKVDKVKKMNINSSLRNCKIV